MEVIKVVIADDHAMVREGIKQLLEMDNQITVTGMASDGHSAIELINSIKPDVLLLDINMPKMNGLGVLKLIKENYNDIKIIILTIHYETEYLIRALEYGVDGYVLKDSESNILKKAIKSVFKGERYIQENMLPALKDYTSNENTKTTSHLKNLTNRELEVLILIAEGLFNKEIAYKLQISEKTVKNHVSNIFKKIKVSDRTQAAVYAIKNNYINIY